MWAGSGLTCRWVRIWTESGLLEQPDRSFTASLRLQLHLHHFQEDSSVSSSLSVFIPFICLSVIFPPHPCCLRSSLSSIHPSLLCRFHPVSDRLRPSSPGLFIVLMYDLITWLIEVLVAATQIGDGEVRLVASTLPPQVRVYPQAHSELIERRVALTVRANLLSLLFVHFLGAFLHLLNKRFYSSAINYMSGDVGGCQVCISSHTDCCIEACPLLTFFVAQQNSLSCVVLISFVRNDAAPLLMKI